MDRWTWFLYAGRRAFSRSAWERWTAILVGSLALASILGGFVLLVTTWMAWSWPVPSNAESPPWIELAVRLLIGLVLIGIGVYWMAAAIWRVAAHRPRGLSRRAPRADVVLVNALSTGAKEFPTVPLPRRPLAPGNALAYRLPGGDLPWGWLAVSSLASLISVGLLSVLTIWAWRSRVQAEIDWWAVGAAVCCLPVAAWSVYRWFRHFLMIVGFGPTQLEISDYPLVPGQRFDVFVSQPGRLRFQLLEVMLRCQEVATFTQGTNIRTESKTVYEERLFRQRGVSAEDPFHCELTVTLPQDAMHSFVSANNRIQWQIVISAIVRGWPRFERIFPIVVRPATP